MRENTRLLILSILTLFVLDHPASSRDRDWPHWSGPQGDRTSVGSELFSAGGVGLQRAWIHDLGSGYSGITVADSLAVTGFSDGEHDLLVAFDVGSGEELWRYRIAETYRGHDGSDDGPIATPTIHQQVVYGLGPSGHLFALRLDSGKLIWQQQVLDLGARKPEYGFASSPAVVDGVLVVQTGGDAGRSISGFDTQIGKLLWSSGDDTVGYQSPLGITIENQEQVLAVTNEHLLGLEPRTGKVLWQHRHSEQGEEEFSQPIRVGDRGVLLNWWPESALFEVRKTADGYETVEVWRTNALKSTYALPAYWQGHLYGYSRNILTCVDAATGEVVWKSRPPGGGSLILVDGHLVIQTDEGEIVIAEANPTGYVEVGRVEALDRGYLTSPSFAAGRVFTRNLTQIASLEITPAASAATGSLGAAADAGDEVALGELVEWIDEIERSEDKKKSVDAFFEEHEDFPIFEGDRLVHFVFRGEVADLALTGNFVQGGDLPMVRVEGTDFYYRSLEVEPASLYTYGFNVFDEYRADPLNPETIGPEEGAQSLLTTPGWEPPSHQAEPSGERGTLESYTWKSDLLENEREVQVYLPPGYADGDERYPLLIVHHGNFILEQGQMDHTLDNLIGKTIEPIVVAFVPRLHWAEYAGSRPDSYARALVEELIPALDRTYRTRGDRESRGLMGAASAGFVSVYAVASYPQEFGRLATQSFYLGDRGEELMATLGESKLGTQRVFLQWSRRDYFDERTGIDAAGQTQQLAELLQQQGLEPVTLETGDGPGWYGWSARQDKALEALYPLR